MWFRDVVLVGSVLLAFVGSTISTTTGDEISDVEGVVDEISPRFRDLEELDEGNGLANVAMGGAMGATAAWAGLAVTGKGQKTGEDGGGSNPAANGMAVASGAVIGSIGTAAMQAMGGSEGGGAPAKVNAAGTSPHEKPSQEGGNRPASLVPAISGMGVQDSDFPATKFDCHVFRYPSSLPHGFRVSQILFSTDVVSDKEAENIHENAPNRVLFIVDASSIPLLSVGTTQVMEGDSDFGKWVKKAMEMSDSAAFWFSGGSVPAGENWEAPMRSMQLAAWFQKIRQSRRTLIAYPEHAIDGERVEFTRIKSKETLYVTMKALTDSTERMLESIGEKPFLGFRVRHQFLRQIPGDMLVLDEVREHYENLLKEEKEITGVHVEWVHRQHDLDKPLKWNMQVDVAGNTKQVFPGRHKQRLVVIHVKPEGESSTESEKFALMARRMPSSWSHDGELPTLSLPPLEEMRYAGVDAEGAVVIEHQPVSLYSSLICEVSVMQVKEEASALEMMGLWNVKNEDSPLELMTMSDILKSGLPRVDLATLGLLSLVESGVGA